MDEVDDHVVIRASVWGRIAGVQVAFRSTRVVFVDLCNLQGVAFLFMCVESVFVSFHVQFIRDRYFIRLYRHFVVLLIDFRRANRVGMVRVCVVQVAKVEGRDNNYFRSFFMVLWLRVVVRHRAFRRVVFQDGFRAFLCRVQELHVVLVRV